MDGYERINDWRDGCLRGQENTVIGDTSDKVSFQEISIILDKCRAGLVKKIKNASGIFITIQLA